MAHQILMITFKVNAITLSLIFIFALQDLAFGLAKYNLKKYQI